MESAGGLSPQLVEFRSADRQSGIRSSLALALCLTIYELNAVNVKPENVRSLD